ncbi:MAG: cell envelope integrity protein CreD [Deltaproteobacteria bacterium]|nr:cell envelope integrity protein CreD [Deltaproteobacteria bacterium]
MDDKNLIERASGVLRNSVSVKILVIFSLAVVLMIPTLLIRGLISERKSTKNSVINEVSSKWGGSQTIAGPVISVPYKSYYKTSNGKSRYNVKYMHFLPDELNINGELFPEKRYRGIYEVILYNSKIDVAGTFARPLLDRLNIRAENVLWKRASIAISISDVRGIQEEVGLVFDGQDVPMKPGLETDEVMAMGISAKIPMNFKKDNYDFRFTLDLNGSRRISFVPVGKVTNLALSSSWGDPSFDGAFLPDERTISDEGFSAKWRVLQFNRSYPQEWKGERHKFNERYNTEDSAFGLKLINTVDLYKKSTRSVKYALLFILFTFTAFFFAEILNKKRLHPVQYLMIGFAVTTFYALLISISEHLSFNLAYLISSAAVIVLVASYAAGVLKSRRLSKVVGLVMTVLYAYFYALLQMEDYALLFGSIGLFVVLGIVMLKTRGIDWYALKLDKD